MCYYIVKGVIKMPFLNQFLGSTRHLPAFFRHQNIIGKLVTIPPDKSEFTEPFSGTAEELVQKILSQKPRGRNFFNIYEVVFVKAGKNLNGVWDITASNNNYYLKGHECRAYLIYSYQHFGWMRKGIFPNKEEAIKHCKTLMFPSCVLRFLQRVELDERPVLTSID
jgi:hypothetical protein